MAIRMIIGEPTISGPHPSGYHPNGDVAREVYYVTHPSNGAILAYCDTRAECDEVIASLAELAQYYARAAEDEVHS